MISEANLIGWLCMIRLSWREDRWHAPSMPQDVQDQLIENGWLEIRQMWPLPPEARFTNLGLAITDLHGADWGIDTIPADQEDQHRGH